MIASVLIFFGWFGIVAIAMLALRWAIARFLFASRGLRLACASLLHLFYLVFAAFVWTRLTLIMLLPSLDWYFWEEDGVARKVLGIELYLLTFIAITAAPSIVIDAVVVDFRARETLAKQQTKGHTFRSISAAASLVVLDLLVPMAVIIGFWSL